MEKKILNILDFQLYSPTSVAYIKLINQVFEMPQNVYICANYLADLMLLATNTHKFAPSLLASAFVFLSYIANEEAQPSAEKVNKCR